MTKPTSRFKKPAPLPTVRIARLVRALNSANAGMRDFLAAHGVKVDRYFHVLERRDLLRLTHHTFWK